MSDSITSIEQCLTRLQAGAPSARQELLEHTSRRLEKLTRAKRKQFPGVEETGDILNDVVLRLDQALRKIQPVSARQFFGLAAKHVHWALLNAAEKRHVSADELDPIDSAAGPATSAETADLLNRLHREVETLPEELREVIDLLFYLGLTQTEAAEAIGVTSRTVRDRLRKAKEVLHDALGGHLPPDFVRPAESQT